MCRSTRTQDHGFALQILAKFILHKSDSDARAERAASAVLVKDVLGDRDAAEGADYWHEHVQQHIVDKASAGYAYDKLIPHFGHMAVRDIRPVDVDRYIAARKAGRLGRPSVGHTISRELSVLNAAIVHAIKAGRLTEADKPFIKKPPSSPPRQRWLTPEEADRLLKAARGDGPTLPRIYRFIMLALNTASRKTALLELKRDQIDMERGLIYLNPADRLQTKKKRATVPISDQLRPMLAQTLNQITGDYVLDHPGAIKTAFNSACRRAGLEGVTPHTLRHTWATWAAQRNVSLFKIAGVLGDTLATVEKTYAHHCPDHLLDAVNAVGESKTANIRSVA